MKKNVLTVVAAVLVLAGCSKNDKIVSNDNWHGEIRLSNEVSVHATKAATPDTQIAKDQCIGVYVEGNAQTTYLYENIQMVADGNGGLLLSNANDKMFYPQTGDSVNISAYHPYCYQDQNFIVKADQSKDADYYASDLLYSKSCLFACSKDAHTLTFVHVLSNVSYTLTAGNGLTQQDLEGAKVYVVNAEIATFFQRVTGVLVPPILGSVKSDVLINAAHGAVVIPQNYNDGSNFLKVCLAKGGELYYKAHGGSGNLPPQVKKTYNITVNLTGLTVQSAITDWTTGGTVDGTAEIF